MNDKIESILITVEKCVPAFIMRQLSFASLIFRHFDV